MWESVIFEMGMLRVRQDQMSRDTHPPTISAQGPPLEQALSAFFFFKNTLLWVMELVDVGFVAIASHES